MRRVISVLAVVGALGGITATSTGCPLPPNSPLPGDLQKAEECVANVFISGGSWQNALVSCASYGFDTIMDAIDSLLGDKAWTAAHPDQVANMTKALEQMKTAKHTSSMESK